MNATLYSHIDVDEVRAGMLKGRDVKQAGSGRESTYIGPAPGVYKKGSLEDTEKFAAFIQNSYEQAGGKYIQGVDDSTVSSFNRIGLDTTQETHTLRLSRPPEIVVEDDSKKPIGGGPTEGVTDVDVAKNIAKDGGSNVLNKWRARGKSLGKLGIGAVGVEGLIQSYQKGYQEATGAGAGPGMAVAAGVGLSAYENVLEPVPVSFLRAQEAGMAGVSDVPADVEGLGPQETDFTRQIEIDRMDARNAAIDEQMKRIQAYDEAMANKESEGEIKADIEIKYPSNGE
jgi:hypothetical protein